MCCAVHSCAYHAGKDDQTFGAETFGINNSPGSLVKNATSSNIQLRLHTSDMLDEHRHGSDSSVVVSNRLRAKTSPKILARSRTAVKTASKPKKRAHSDMLETVEPESCNLGPDVWLRRNSERMPLLDRLFSWRRWMWRAWLHFRRSVQHAPLDEGLQMQVVGEMVQSHGCQRFSVSETTAVSDNDIESMTAALQSMNEISMSSSFSGVDAPCTSFLMLGLGLCEELSMSAEHIPRPRNAFAIEWTHHAQQELKAHPHSPGCVFGDITQFWNTSTAIRMSQLLECEDAVNNVLLPLMKQRQATTRTGWCLVHNRKCEVGRKGR